ncbi:MAG TPA: alpha/beta hydrolase [Opitutaceae bacterium]|nr:alpha/beta hydrolase [Opitutaceae bacterium]
MKASRSRGAEKLSMNDLFHMAWRLLAVFAVLYVIAAILGHFWSLRLIFPRPPPSYALGADHFQLTTPDGVKLAARHWANPAAKHTLLWFYGNGEDLGALEAYVTEWVRRGFAVMAVDYRGYGRSGGEPTEAAAYADAALALDWLKNEKGVPASRIVLMGYSLGSGPAVELATREKVAGLILIAPLVSAYRVMTNVPLLPGDKFVNVRKIPRIRCPVLILHGTVDRTVPFWHGKKLFELAPEPKRHLWVEGAGHGDLEDVAGERYWTAIRGFADSL